MDKKIDKNFILNDVFKKGSIYFDLMKNILRGDKNLDILTSIVGEGLCNIDEDKLIYLYNKNELKYYIIRIIMNQVRSKNSYFYKERLMLSDGKNFIDDIDCVYNLKVYDYISMYDTIDEINIIRESIITDYYTSTVFKMYFDEGMTYREIAKELGVTHPHIFKIIKNQVKKIKNKIK